MRKSIKKSLLYLFKSGLSFFALWYIFRHFGNEEILNSLQRISFISVTTALCLYLFSQFISSLRLRLLLVDITIIISPLENFRLYLIGMAYNLFIPGGIGGDGYKLWLLKKKYKAPGKKILQALLLDRLNGLLAITCLLAILFSVSKVEYYGSGLYWIAVPIIYLLFSMLTRHFFGITPSLSVQLFIYSVSIQLLQIAAALILALSLGLNAWIEVSCIFLISSLATALPIFLGGAGARESVFAFLSVYASINTSSAIAVGLLFSIITVISSLPGLILDWSIKTKDEKPKSLSRSDT